MILLLLLIFLVAMFFVFVEFMTAITAVITIIMGSISVTTLTIVWIVTAHSLKKAGYDSKRGQQTYQEVKSGLQELSADLSEFHLQLAKVEPLLRDREFLKYARQARPSTKKSP